MAPAEKRPRLLQSGRFFMAVKYVAADGFGSWCAEYKSAGILGLILVTKRQFHYYLAHLKLRHAWHFLFRVKSMTLR